MVDSGYIGLVSRACFADFGHDVACIDKDQGKIDRPIGTELALECSTSLGSEYRWRSPAKARCLEPL